MGFRSSKILEPSSRLVFISHASEDDAFASELAEALSLAHVRTWVDNSELHRESPLDLVEARVWDGLHSSTDLIAVVSEASISKPWVKHEWLVASGRWLVCGFPRIHLVMRGHVEATPSLPYTSLKAEGPGLIQSLLQNFGDDAQDDRKPTTETEWRKLASQLRSQYLMGGPTAVQAVHHFDSVLPDLVGMIDVAADVGFGERHALAVELLRSLSMLLDLRADPKWLGGRLHKAARSDLPDGQLRNILLNNAGMAKIYEGNWPIAEECLRDSIAGCRMFDDASGVAIGYGNVALMNIERGDLQSATHWIGQATGALDVVEKDFRAGCNRTLAFETFITRGNLANHRGRVLAASRQYVEAEREFGVHLAIAEALESRRGIGVALGRMAWNHILSGKNEATIGMLLERYLAISVSTLNPRGVANALNWMGQLDILNSNYRDAVQHFVEESDLRAYLADQVGLVQSLAWLATAYRAVADDGRYRETACRLRAAAVGVVLGKSDRAMVEICSMESVGPIAPSLLRELEAAGMAFKKLAGLDQRHIQRRQD